MPITKKDRIKKEHKQADKAGTRVQVHANGTPVKKDKPKSICAFCRKELVCIPVLSCMIFHSRSNSSFQDNTNLKILEQHAGTHPEAWTKEKCWPKEFA